MLVVAAFLAPTVGSLLSEQTSGRMLAQAGASQFLMSAPAGLPTSRVDRTMAQLEKAYTSLSTTWGIADDDSPVPVQLYTDVFENPSKINEHRSVAGAVRCTATGPEILLAAEETGTLEPSSVPRHEIVHAMMCEALGQSLMNLIPRWFHEGTATYYENDGWRDMPNRSARRLHVWLSRDSLLEPAEFCGYFSDQLPSQVSMFYATAGEFVEELVQRYSPDVIPDVAFKTAETMDFERAFSDVTGSICTRIYAEWIAGF